MKLKIPNYKTKIMRDGYIERLRIICPELTYSRALDIYHRHFNSVSNDNNHELDDMEKLRIQNLHLRVINMAADNVIKTVTLWLDEDNDSPLHMYNTLVQEIREYNELKKK